VRPFTHTIPFERALELTLGAAVPLDRTETVPLGQADGRVVARDVRAGTDVPPFDRAAMDGYAVVAADTAGASSDQPASLRCVGRVVTGQVSSRVLRPGECIEIATGAPVPAGADAVVMVEQTGRSGDDVWIREAAAAGQHIGRRGGDLSPGELVVATGHLLDPARVGALAAVGTDTVEVFARPSVALVSTGDELVGPGQPLGPGQIHDINRHTLAAIVERHGGVAAALPPAGDSMEALSAVLDQARRHDVVVFSGGSSVGDRDLVGELVAARGVVLYHGIAVKPGKPTLLGHVEGMPVFGMPGNPTSCLSNGYLLLAPFLRRLARLPAWIPRRVEVPLGTGIRSSSDRHQFYTVRLTGGSAEPAFKGSGEITSMAHADGYIEIPAGTSAVAAGTVVTVTLF